MWELPIATVARVSVISSPRASSKLCLGTILTLCMLFVNVFNQAEERFPIVVSEKGKDMVWSESSGIGSSADFSGLQAAAC